MLYDVVIIGAGLCGLSSAALLKKNGLRVLVLEARPKLGGRILSVRDFDSNECLGDLGPTWVWPEQQPILSSWLDSLGVSTFRQYSEGSTLVDLSADSSPHLQNVAAQPDVYRIDAGTSNLISVLADKFASDELACSEWVTKIDTTGLHVKITTRARSEPLQAKHVIVAVPPRIAVANIQYSPPLEKSVANNLSQSPTWMAQHAKVVILYADAFWRRQNLSGHIVSQVGPLAELQDHCAPIGFPAALTGFLLWNSQRRVEEADSLSDQIIAQLARLFGADAPEPLHIVIKDWAQDKCAAVQDDLLPGGVARQVLPDNVRQVQGDGKLLFAGAELATTSPGLLEGALARAEEVAAKVMQLRQSVPECVPECVPRASDK